MPIYEYTCEACDEGFETLVRTKSAQVACPKCGSKRVRKGISSFCAGSVGTDGSDHATHGG